MTALRRVGRILSLTIDVLAWTFVVASFAAALIPPSFHEDHSRWVHVKGGLIMLAAILIIRWAETEDAC